MAKKRADRSGPRAAAVRPNGEILLYGVIGDWWDGLDAKTVVKDIDRLGEVNELVVRINSPGGLVHEGMSIFNHLVEHDAGVTVKVDGLAASMASMIALAGDRIVMGTGSMMMIHNPWSFSWGDANDLRKTANVLEKIQGQCVGLYAEHTGLSPIEIAKMMADETWMTDEEAVELGFADETVGEDDDEETDGDEPADLMRFDLSIFQNVPDLAQRFQAPGKKNPRGGLVRVAAGAAEHPERGETMARARTKTKGSVDPKSADDNTVEDAEDQQDAATGSEEDDGSETDDVTAAADAAREQAAAITAAVSKAKLPASFAAGLIKKGVTLEQAQAAIIDAWAAKEEGGETRNQIGSVQLIADSRDKLVKGVGLALVARAGWEGGEKNEFTGYSLKEIARLCLEQQGVKTRGMDSMTLVGTAFTTFSPRSDAGGHGTSDFGWILINVANKGVLKGYEEADETFERWTSTGTLPNFQPQTRIDLNLFDSLDPVGEHGEYKYGTIGDRGITVRIATYGKLFKISRQAVINDDLGQFTRIPARMGRAAKRTIGNLVWDTLINNEPLPGHTTPLFHASHGNLAETPAAPSSDSFDAMRTSMARQVDPDGKATGGLNIRPKFGLVPVTLEGQATVVLQSEFDTNAGDKRLPNKARNMVEIIADARLDTASTTAWYGVADPMATDTIEVSYLEGQTTPRLENRQGWTVDGTEFKISQDTGVNVLDHRGFYRNPGA